MLWTAPIGTFSLTGKRYLARRHLTRLDPVQLEAEIVRGQVARHSSQDSQAIQLASLAAHQMLSPGISRTRSSAPQKRLEAKGEQSLT